MKTLGLFLILASIPAMPQAALAPVGVQQFFDNTGVPLSGGTVTTYIAGTTTKLATYTDATGTIPASNPIVLDAGGFASIWLGGGSYKFVVKRADGTLVSTTDNITTVNAGITGLVNVWTQPQVFAVGPFYDATGYSGTDIFAKTNAAIAALPTRSYNGNTYPYGTILIPLGTYSSVATTLTIGSPFVAVECMAGTQINYTGTGDAVRVQMNPFPTGSDWHAQYIRNCDINGNSSAASLVHMGDVVGFGLINMQLANATTGKCLWMDDTTNWTEQTWLLDTKLANCAKVWDFTVTGSAFNSFGYTRATNVSEVVRAGQEGIAIEAGFLYNSEMSVSLNMADPTAVGVHVYPGVTAKDNFYWIRGECVSNSPCSGASILTVDATGDIEGFGSIMGLAGTTTTNISGNAHIGLMKTNDDTYHVEWAVDNGLRVYFNGNAYYNLYTNTFRMQSASVVLGWSTGVTTTANNLGLSEDSANVLDCGNGAFQDKTCTFNAARGNFSTGIDPGTTTVGSLPSAASAIGIVRRVSDSTAVAAEGQTCVGGSTGIALAFSNGTVWKCF